MTNPSLQVQAHFIENTGYSSSWTWTNTLNYSKVFAKKHSLKILAGTENIK